MQDQTGSNHDVGRSALSLPTPPANTSRTDSLPEPCDRAHLEMFHIPVNEACVGTAPRYFTMLMDPLRVVWCARLILNLDRGDDFLLTTLL